MEVLLLSPNGKLLVRSNAKDRDDPTRVQRHEAWQERVGRVERGDTLVRPAGAPGTGAPSPFGTPAPGGAGGPGG